ncbi:hypothetical protein [Pelagovum pacificum]|uniref:Uncharacterized protein n=1 Tax=Pelagovum pacificum TaxID=2588711 RepID=A0A5C5GDC5_9RHOB|nr:hypothetical protein [Pelagovum pacificum]QQA41203.1 hypothetical protein I8N54_10190 [Pelagovum pacificum]TNY31989.1 hypothetical protein FHY64_01410 [Pelagovum pacificum]
MHTTRTSGTEIDDVRQFVIAERSRCLSDREWRHRLAGYGYGIRDGGAGHILTSLIHGRDLCPLNV